MDQGQIRVRNITNKQQCRYFTIYTWTI